MSITGERILVAKMNFLTLIINHYFLSHKDKDTIKEIR